MVRQLLADQHPAVSSTAERDLRRQIDVSISRALFDDDYARRLLMDPTVAVEDTGCQLQLLKSLSAIHAADLVDFARQARALFWRVEPPRRYLGGQLPLAAAAR
jgi:hypothetical protein